MNEYKSIYIESRNIEMNRKKNVRASDYDIINLHLTTLESHSTDLILLMTSFLQSSIHFLNNMTTVLLYTSFIFIFVFPFYYKQTLKDLFKSNQK